MIKRIGFVGIGVMGNSMVKHLLNANYDVMVYTRTKEKAKEVLELGAKWSEDLVQLANHSELVITMVGYPSDVEEVYLGEKGLLNNLSKNAICIDMTTSSPSLAKKLFEVGQSKGIHCLDAPVSGGDIGAQNATLSIMVGGVEEVFERIIPILAVLGTNIVYQGEAGSGQHAKMCNQIAIASNMIGVCEALIYAKKSGLDPEDVLKSIQSGAAGSWSLSNLAPRILKEDFAPGFYIKHFIKDMKIAVEETIKMGISLPGLETSLKMYLELEKQGYEENGTQALIKYWDK